MRLRLLAFVLVGSTLLIGQSVPPSSAKIVVVEDISVTNDSLVSSEHLKQLRQEITKQRYGQNAGNEIASLGRYELQEDGYFKANVEALDARVLTETPVQSTVAVTLRINEGRQYRLQTITFANNKTFSSSILRQAFAIKDHDVFDTGKIRQGLEELQKLYASEGYINIAPVPDTYPNDETGTVTLRVDLDEGKQFTIGSLMVGGNWPDGAQEKLAGIFHSYAGGFDVSGFIEQLKAATLAMFPGLASADGLVKVRPNVETATVEVSINRPALANGLR
jgi:outer membrane translocation and assembly module TamA